MERNERKLCALCIRKHFIVSTPYPFVEVNKCLLEYELILCLEKKMLWNSLTDIKKCERDGGKPACMKPA